MVKRPTIEDLAKAAGVSVATVDRVLNRRLPVREDTAILVVQAAESIGYHATSLLKRRLTEVPARRFGFLLQKKHVPFYQNFGAELTRATTATPLVRGKAFVEFSEELTPQTIARRLQDMAQRCDALAVVAVDHPTVNGAVENIVASGKHVFTLLSDIATPSRRTYLAADTRKAGRTAAWAISRIAKKGKVGVLVGSHRYLSQETAEISFRSYMREHASEMPLLESVIILDDDRICYEAATHMLQSNPDLVGIYAAGGGQEGLVRALRESGRAQEIVAVCNELTANNKAALIDGTLDLVLDTPIAKISEKVVQLMCEACEAGDRTALGQILFPVDMYISENI
jgi:LacI family transcriptional regulator